MSPFLPPPTPNSRSSAPPPPPPLLQLQKRERGRGKRCGRKEGMQQNNLSPFSLSLSLRLPHSSSLPQTWKRRRRENSNKTTTPPKPDDRPCLRFLPCPSLPSGRAGLASPQRKQQRRRTIFFPSSHAQKPTAVRCADRRPKIRHEVPPGSFRQAPVELHGACCVCPLCTTCQPVLRR